MAGRATLLRVSGRSTLRFCTCSCVWKAQFPTADLRPPCVLAGLYSCIELIERHDVAHVEGMGMAELKAAEDWPVRDASPCPRCRPWCRRARTRPTAAIDLPDQPTRGHLFTGVVADVCRRGGRRGGRGGLSPPLPRVDPGAAMLRATRPGDDRRNDLTSCSGAQAGWPLRGRAQASYAAAGQPQGSSGGHSSGGLRGSPKPGR